MGRAAILEAALRLFRQKGFAATSVDDLCAAAGVTKGAFFHHFRSKDDLGTAAVRHWSDTTAAMFAAADYHRLADPLDRVFGYLDLRRSFLAGEIWAFSCVAGTLAQETHASHPAIRDAAGQAVRGGAAHVHDHLAEALARHPVAGVDAATLAQFVQVAVQGGIVVAKALDDPAAAMAAFDHVERYLRLLFGRDPAPAMGRNSPIAMGKSG